MKQFFLLYILIIFAQNSFAQAPVINDVQPLIAGPNQKIIINGNGFSSTSSQLAVWFDHVKGTITNSTNFSIEVQVPAQAHYSNVEVINLSNNLSAKSSLRFLPSYGGVQFDETKMIAATPVAAPYIDGNEMFDVVSSDLDLDGKPDLVTSRGGPTSVASITDLYIYKNVSTGIGNINFTRFDKSTIAALNVGGPTANVACGDLNGDGKPDIVATRGGSTRNEVFIVKNTNATVGTLSFASQTKLILPPPDLNNPTLNLPLSFKASIRDLNGDGKPEIVISNSQDNRVFIFLNTGSAGAISFNPTPIQILATGATNTYGLDIQDLDGDSMPDLILNQFLSQDIYIFRNTSTGNISFAPVQKITSASGFSSVISADVDGDNKPDIVASANLDNNIQIWYNQSTSGTISFGTQQTLATTGGPWGLDVSDIDGDGDVDIIVANKGGSALNIFRQDSPKSFVRKDIATPNYFSRNLRVGDFDGDAKPDIVYTAIPTSGLQFTVNVLRNGNCWAPVITGPSTQICIGQTIPLATNPALGVTYDWKLGGASQPGGNTSSFNATAVGTYTVTYTGTVDLSCVNTSANYVLTLNSNPFPSDPVINNNVPCLGSALNLSTGSVATATYTWSGPNNFTKSGTTAAEQNPSISPVTNTNAGVYTLQLTLSNGCKSNIISKQLDVASVPVLPITASPSATGCVGSTITLNLPSTTGYTFKWNKGGSPIGGQTGSSLSLTSLTAASEGNYSVTVTSTATTCSQETALTAVQVFTVPVADFTMSTPQCKGIAITFTDQSTKDPRGTLVYAWAFGDGATSTTQSPPHTYASASGFAPNLKVSYAEASTCSNNITKPITVNAPVVPTIQSTANPICTGDQTTLSITGSYTTIAWVGVTGSSTSVMISQEGKYKVNTTDANGCTSKDSITITLKPLISPFTVKAFKPIINLGDTTKLTATFGADSYLWNNSSTLTDATIYNPIANPQVTTKYIVIAKKAGSCDAKDSVTVTVNTSGAIITPPVLFSPNGDNKNDIWKLCYNPNNPSICPEETTYIDWTMTIFDGHGSQVYQQKGFTGWDGGSAPEGIYYFVFSDSKGTPSTGSVLLVRQKP